MRVSICSLCPWILCVFCVTSCDSSLPHRELAAGDCFASSDCSDSTQVCRNNQCVGCIAHGECQSQICDTYGDLPGGGAGKCMPTSSVIYVSNRDFGVDTPCLSDMNLDGSKSAPYCSLSQALTAAKSQTGKMIRVLSSPNVYALPNLDANSGNVILIGSGFQPGDGSTLAVDSEIDPTHFMWNGANAVIDGFRFGGASIKGTGGKITIRRSKIDYLLEGLSFDGGCTVTLDRNLFTECTLGLTFDGCTVNMTNSILYQNTVDMLSSFLTLKAGSGSFQFNTIAYNLNMSTTPVPPLISCVGTQIAVKNSIFVQNGVTQTIDQGCSTASNNVVGRADQSSGQIKQEPNFDNAPTYNLALNPADATNQQYLIDKAVVNGSDKNVDHDYNGAPRPQGQGHDIGAFEAAAMK